MNPLDSGGELPCMTMQLCFYTTAGENGPRIVDAYWGTNGRAGI